MIPSSAEGPLAERRREVKGIILTGYSKKEFQKNKGIIARCYLCKRRHNDESICYLEDKNGGFSVKLYFGWVKLIKGAGSGLVGEDTKFKFYLCRECLLLMEAMVERLESSKIFSGYNAGRKLND